MRSGERQPAAPQAIRRASVFLLAVLSVGCASTLVDYSPTVHVVQPGDTVYSIAWRHRVSHHELARWNGLSDPNLIFVGQRLRLRPGTPSAASAPTRPSSEPRARPLPAPPKVPPPRWQWPTRGPLLRAFGSSDGLVNGIGIGGQAGQEVGAAAAGRVVYAGSGLQAYGQLVIINHNDSFLSAYGYNERVLVSQGQDVRAGQAIATMGLGPQRRAQLHFEIRQNGTPVDPLRHLPR